MSFKPPGSGATIATAGMQMIKDQNGTSLKSGSDPGTPAAPGTAPGYSKTKKRSTGQPSFLGDSATPPPSMSNSGGKTLLGQ